MAVLPQAGPAPDRDAGSGLLPPRGGNKSLPVGDPVPARAHGVELLGEVPGSGYRTPPALARRADGQTIQLTPLLYLVLSEIDGRRGYGELAARVSSRYGRAVSADNIRMLVERKLTPLGLLRGADGAEPVVSRSNPLLALRCRFVVSNPRVTRRITAPFTVLFNPLVVVAVTLVFAAVTYWVLFQKGLASAAYQAFNQPSLLLTVFLVTAVSAGFHEFGHAAAARRAGATPGAMGVGLYLFWPAFYTNVTDSYRLGRGGRLCTDLGGLYFNAIVAVGMFGAWWLTGWDALLLIIATQVLQMIRQLAPLVRFDGYHVLADLTGVPDLYHRIGPTLRGLLPRRGPNAAERVALKPWARAVVTGWVLLVMPLLLASLLLMVLALPRMLATGWQSLGHQWTLLRDAWGHDDISGGLAKVLAIAAIAVPLLGTALLIVRLVRRTVRRGWRTTAGHPVRRTLAGVAGLAVIAALAWAWWPNPGTYRPIRPGERGTVQDAVPAARTVPIGHRPVGLHEGAGGRAKTVWAPGRARPTARHPELALLLVPTPGSAPSAPTWVFPFNQPPPPGAGDNQALAVNTTDNSIVYDVAFALVWVTDGSTVDNRNEAYALASCQNCATVAVAFQVVLIVGQAHVAVPQNVAAAVNYACTQCVTAALANQLVLTVPADLSDAAKAKLAEVWRQIEDFARGIQGVPLNQLRDDLARFEQLIAAIIQQDTGSPGSSAPTSVPPVDPSSPQPSAPGSTATDPSMPGSQAPPPESTTTSPPPTSSDPPSTTSPTPAPTTTP